MTFRNPYSLPFLARFAPEYLVLATPGAPASSEHSRRISTNAFPGWLSKSALPAIGRTLRHGGRGLAGFVRDSGVPGNRISAYGRGEDQPVASNLTPDGRAKNRRVEIIIRPNR